MKRSTDYLSTLRSTLATSKIQTYHINGARVIVCPDRNLMGYVAGILVLFRLSSNVERERTTLELARAGSMLEAWETISRQLKPGDLPPDRFKAFFYDEIKGNRYEHLWMDHFVAKAPSGVLSNVEMIKYGDGSRTHAEEEASRLNAALKEWNDCDDRYTLSVFGTSPNPEKGPKEFHLAFQTNVTSPDTVGPYFPMPMTEAASVQQANEGLVADSKELIGTYVNSMTAHHICNADDLIGVIPENRGRHLYQMLHGDPQVEPGAKIGERSSKASNPNSDFPSVTICTIEDSWNEYKKEEAAA